MTPARRRTYLLASAAYYPALTLALVAGLWAAGKPYDLRTVLAFLVVTALAGAAVGALLRPQILKAYGAKVVLVAILALVVGTPIVVLPELLFGLSGLGLDLDFQGAVIALLVATLAISFNPIAWAASSGYVLLLRRAALHDAAAASASPAA